MLHCSNLAACVPWNPYTDFYAAVQQYSFHPTTFLFFPEPKCKISSN